MTTRLGDLRAPQSVLLDAWLPGAAVVRDHSWELLHRHVLEVLHDGVVSRGLGRGCPTHRLACAR